MAENTNASQTPNLETEKSNPNTKNTKRKLATLMSSVALASALIINPANSTDISPNSATVVADGNIDNETKLIKINQKISVVQNQITEIEKNGGSKRKIFILGEELQNLNNERNAIKFNIDSKIDEKISIQLNEGKDLDEQVAIKQHEERNIDKKSNYLDSQQNKANETIKTLDEIKNMLVAK